MTRLSLPFEANRPHLLHADANGIFDPVSALLRYDLIDRPGVLGNYVPVNYHSLYDLSLLVEGV